MASATGNPPVAASAAPAIAVEPELAADDVGFNAPPNAALAYNLIVRSRCRFCLRF